MNRRTLQVLLVVPVLFLSIFPLHRSFGDEEEGHYPDTPKYKAITEKFGNSSYLPEDLDEEQVMRKELERVPWSSWWYPLRSRVLFERGEDKKSTLEKYDFYVQQTRGTNPGATAWHKENVYPFVEGSWTGLCDSWAIASLLEPEPNKPVDVSYKEVVHRSFGRVRFVRRNMTFDVGDLKALLILTYQETQGLSVLGERFNGQYRDVYADIYPEQFHRFLEVHFFKNKKNFIIDKDPGVEIWSAPVYGVTMNMQRDQENPMLLHVKTILVVAGSENIEDLNYVGTKVEAYAFTYNLYLQEREGRMVVTHGKWTGHSQGHHPDFIMTLPEANIQHKSGNPKIDYSIVQEILRGGQTL